MPETHFSAEIDREELVGILANAKTGLKAKHEKAVEAMEDSITKVVNERLIGILWWRRKRTRDQASDFLYNHFVRWDERREASIAAENVRRVAKLTDMVAKDSLTSIRLSENDLALLTEFMP